MILIVFRFQQAVFLRCLLLLTSQRERERDEFYKSCLRRFSSLSLSTATFCLLGRGRRAQLDLLTISIILHLLHLCWVWSKYLWLSLIYEVLALNQSKKNPVICMSLFVSFKYTSILYQTKIRFGCVIKGRHKKRFSAPRKANQK